MDILGVGAIVTCGAMILDGNGGEILNFAQTALKSFTDLIGGLFNREPEQQQQTNTVSGKEANHLMDSDGKPVDEGKAKLDHMSNIFAVSNEVQKDGKVLSFDEAKQYFDDAIQNEMKNNQYDLQNPDDYHKFLDNIMDSDKNGGVQIKRFEGMDDRKNFLPLVEIERSMNEVGTADTDLLKSRISDNIAGFLNQSNKIRGLEPLTVDQKKELQDMVDRSFGSQDNPYSAVHTLSNELNKKDWYSNALDISMNSINGKHDINIDNSRLSENSMNGLERFANEIKIQIPEKSSNEMATIGSNRKIQNIPIQSIKDSLPDKAVSVDQLTYNAKQQSAMDQVDKQANVSKNDSLTR